MTRATTTTRRSCHRAVLALLLACAWLGLAGPTVVVAQDAAGSGADGAQEQKLDAARERWAKMSPEEREAVTARWRELQQLSPEERQRALENFKRLQASGSESSDPQVSPTPTPMPAPDDSRRVDRLAPEIERMARDDIYRDRMRQLDRDMGDMFRDPEVRERLMNMSADERRSYLMELRHEAMRQRTREMLLACGIEGEQAEELIEAFEEQRREEDRVIREHLHQRMQLERDTIERVSDELGPDAARMAERLLGATRATGGPDDRMFQPERGDRHGDRRRDGHGDGRPDRPDRPDRDRPGRTDRPDRADDRGPASHMMIPEWPRWERAARQVELPDAVIEDMHRAIDELQARLDGPPEGRPTPEGTRHELMELVNRLVPEDRRREFFGAIFGGGGRGAGPDRGGRGGERGGRPGGNGRPGGLGPGNGEPGNGGR